MELAHYAHIEEVVNYGDGLIFDAFGVFWAGGKDGFYPGSLDVFKRLFERGIPIVILSNATQLSERSKAKYAVEGLDKQWYISLLTSGQITREVFLDQARLKEIGLHCPRKTYWIYQSAHLKYGSPHIDIFKDTGYECVSTLEEADFIYVGIPHLNGEDQKDSSVFEEEIKSLVKTQKPMLVANPDRYVEEGKGEFVVRQGEIGRIYESYGGRVFYLGKPSQIAFEMAIKLLEKQGVQKDRIWMVGDNLETDILGANLSSIKSLLVCETGVTHANFLKEKEKKPKLSIEDFISELPHEKRPSALVDRFAPVLDKSHFHTLGE